MKERIEMCAECEELEFNMEDLPDECPNCIWKELPPTQVKE